MHSWGCGHILELFYAVNPRLCPHPLPLFLFCGKRSDRIKGLLWDEDGFLLLYKRVDNGRFQWPRSEAEIQSLSHEQFVRLMQGLSIYQPKAIRKNTPNDIV